MTIQLDDLPMQVSSETIVAFCRKWKVQQLALFGSVLNDTFRPDSDVDVLVTFEENAPWSLWDWPDMQNELSAIFGRKIDLVEKRSLRNPYRRESILNSHRVIYAA